MARKSMKVQDRIKKSPAANEWMRNVAKSMKITTFDVVTDLMPNTSDFLQYNKSDTIDMLRDMRTNTGTRQMINRQFKNIPQIKAANNALKNAMSDIKSGNLNNRARELDFDDDDTDYGFGIFDESDQLEFIDDEPENNNKPVTVIDTMPLAKMINNSTEATVNTMIAVADQQMAIESEKLMYNHKSTSSILGGLSAINDNLATLVKFNAESTAKYHAASLKFYEDTADYIKRANDLLKKQEQKEKEESIGKYSDDLFTYTGGVKLNNYMKIIKKNIRDMKDENAMVASIADSLTDPDTLKAMTKNPIGALMSIATKSIIPAATQLTVKALDQSISSVFPAVLAKINTLDGNDNPILNAIYKVFGSKNKVDYEVKLGNYEKGAIPWDGESKKALVEVIPAYLRRIESALTGQDERVYNFSTGKFSKVGDIKKDYEKSLREAETSGFSDTKLRMKEIARSMKANEATMDQFEKDMEEYFSRMTKKGAVISPFITKGKDGFSVDEFLNEGLFDYDPKRTAMMRKVLKGLSMHELTKMATTGIYDSGKSAQEFMNEVRKNPNLHGYSTIYNETDKNGKPVAYTPGKRPGMTDKFEKTQLDYLRDIRSALINGIRVFPDTQKRYSGWRPNNALLKQERAENKIFKNSYNTNNTSNVDDIFNQPANYDEVLGLSDEELQDIYDQNKNTKKTNNKHFKKINKAMDSMIDIVDAQIFRILFGVDEERAQGSKDEIENLKDMASNSKAAGLLSKVKDVFTNDKKNGKVGLLTRLSQDFMDGFEQFKVSLFGKSKDQEKNKKETFKELMEKIKPRLPKAIAAGFGGALIKTTIASNMGILGSLLLPGGPLGAALVGTTYGFLRQSETFNKWMFGEKDEDGKRTGGFIPKSVINAYDKYGVSIKKGAGIGFLASFLLPGGPIAGSLLGVGAAVASKNDAFQEFLFGKDFKEKDKKSLMNGAFGKLFKNGAKKDIENPKLATFLGGAGLTVGLAQGVGLLPSFLLPGGPIVGSMLGLAAGITASSDKFQEFLFGEKDVDGKRYGGLVTKFTNWFNTSVVEPLKIKATAINDKIYGFLRKKVFDPIIGAFEPIKQAGKFLIEDAKNAIINSFKNTTEPIVNSFREHVTKPLGKMLKTALINPIFRILKGTFSMFTKTIGSVLTSPIKLLSGVGYMADRYNERHVLKGVDTKGMSKEEKQELLNEALEYRNGMTRKERRKARKKDYKDEMTRRADRRAEMQKQYEEDKKFGKESGWKFASKKQQEQREKELKDKQAWLQEKLVTETEDNGEKVSKVHGVVEKISEFEDKGVKLLEDIGKSLKDIRKAIKPNSEEGMMNNLGKKLRDKGQSHADGLDTVPQDGYIAELHKGEMVVPKKPAGLLRNMFKSGGSLLGKLFKDDKKDRADNALGLSDEEADQMNELEDRDRYKKASRKSVDFVMGERKKELKEKEEKKWRTDILSAIHNVGDRVSAGAEKGNDLLSSLGSLFSKVPNLLGKLSPLAIAGSIAYALHKEWKDYQDSEEYIESRTDADGTMVYDNADAVINTKTGRIALKEGIKGVNKGKKFIAKHGSTISKVGSKIVEGGSKLKNGITKVGGTIGKSVDDFINPKVTAQGESFLGTAYKYTGDVVDTSARKGIAKPVGKVVDATKSAKGKAKDMVGKFMNLAKEAMGILSAKVCEKFPKAKKITNCVDDVFRRLAKDSDSVFKKFSKKIALFFTDLGLDLTGVGTVAEIGMTAYDVLSGLTAGNTGNLFGVSPENVDAEMRAICSFLQGVCQFSFMAVLWIINEMTNSMYGFNFIRIIATAIYNALPNVGKTINLNKKLNSKDVDSSSSIEEVLKKAGVTDTSKYKDKNGNWVDFSDLELEEGDQLSATDLEEVARFQYNQENGTKLDSDAWIDKNSQTLGSKIMGNKWTKNFLGSFKGDSIRGHMKLNKDAKLTLKDRFLYAGGSAIVNTSNAVGNLLGIDAMKNWSTEQMFTKYSKRRTEKYTNKLNSAESKIEKLKEKNENTDSKLKLSVNNALIKYYEMRAKSNRKKLGTAEKKVKDETKEEKKNTNTTSTIGDKNIASQTEKDAYLDQYEALGMAEVNRGKTDIDEEFGVNTSTNSKDLKKAAETKKKSNSNSKGKTEADKKIEKSAEQVSSSVNASYNKFNNTIKKTGSIIVKGMANNLGIFGKSFNLVTGTLSRLAKKTSKDISDDTSKSTKDLTKNSKGLVDSVKNTFSTVSSKVKDVMSNVKNINVSPISIDTIKEFGNNILEKLFGKDEEETSTSTNKSKDSNKNSSWVSKLGNGIKNAFNFGTAGPETRTQSNSESGFVKPVSGNDKYVFYSQSDNRWSKNAIGNKTMSTAGCGPTSLAMAISQMTGEEITPDVIAKMGKDYLPGYSSYGLFPEVAKKFNMNYYDTNSATDIISNLQSGTPVILSGKNLGNNASPYTDEGHIVVANSIDGENVFVTDPRGKEYSKTYKLSQLMSGLNKAIVMNPTTATKNKLSESKGSIPGIRGEFIGSINPTLFDENFTKKELSENLGSEGSKIRLYEKIIGYAKAFTEKLKYSYGSDAIDRNGSTTDCSAFTRHVFKRAGGIDIPRSSAAQLKIGTKIPIDQAQAGDLVLWNGHSGLVIDSNGNMIDAGSGSVPKIRSFMTDYWKNKYGGTRTIRRVLTNPNELVDPTVSNPHTGIGFSGTVDPQGGGDVSGGASSSGSTSSSSSGTDSSNPLGVFGKMGNIAQNMMASIFNGKEVDLFASSNTSTDTTTNTGGTVDISGVSDYATGVWKFLTGKGYSPQAAAGILGNMTQESGVDPTVIQGGGKGPAAGICQWENWRTKSSRWKAMSDYAASKGKDWKDLQSQLEWLDLELQGKDPTTLSKLKSLVGGYEGFKKLTDVNKATEVFEKAFERAGKPNMARRYSSANSYYQKFANGADSLNGDNGPVPTATSAQSAPSDGSIPTSMNGWSYYKQGDPKWQEDIGGKKIGPSGCGMASHAMMLTSMFGKEINPVTVGKFGRAKGLWSNGMSWGFPAAIAREFNLDMSPVVEKSGGASKGDLDAVKSAIKNGRPVILSGKGVSKSKSPFTTGGHIVLAVGVDGNNRLIINDPRGPQYTRAYEDNEVMDIGTGLRGAWSFDTNSSSKIPEGWETGSSFSAGSYSGTTDGTTSEGSAPAVDQMGVFGQMGTIAQNMMTNIFGGNTSINTGTTTAGGSTGTGTFPKYNLNDSQIKGIANILYHEQPGPEGMQAEASLMANLTDMKGDSYATTDNLVKTATGGWFAKGKSRFNNPGSPSTTAINAVKSVLVNGKRTLPRYVNEHDCFSDITSATNNGSSIKKTDRSAYKQHETKIKNRYGASGTFYSFPNSKSDPFYYTSEENRSKWGENCYSPSSDNAGMGEGEKVKYNRINTDKGGDVTKLVKATQREMEKTTRMLSQAPIKAYDENAMNKACMDVLNVIIEQLQAINTNTANTAKGVSDIQIVSANEPISTNNKTTKVNKNGTNGDLRKANEDTGYDIARKIASYK